MENIQPTTSAEGTKVRDLFDPPTFFESLSAPMTLWRRQDAPGDILSDPLYVVSRNDTHAFLETRRGLPCVLTREDVESFYQREKP